MSKIQYFVYRSDLVGAVPDLRMIVRWGVCESHDLLHQAWRPNEVAVENISNQRFPTNLGETGTSIDHYYNISSGAFDVQLYGVIPNLPFGGDNQAINFGVQENSRHIEQNRLLRYFANEGSFGLGSIVPSSLTNFTAAAPPTGFYRCQFPSLGGPSGATYPLLVLVQRLSDNITFFTVRSVETGDGYREWVGVRTTATGAVTWKEVTSGGALAALDTIDLTYLPTAWVKEGCRLCSVNNINVGTGGLVTIDGQAATDGARILLVGQTNPAENGIWIASTSSWTRAPDANTVSELVGSVVSVWRGTTYGGTLWATTLKQPNTLGVAAINWFQVMHSGTTFGDNVSGVVPASGGGEVNFLRADGAWASPAAQATTIASLTGTVTISFGGGATGSGQTKTINIGAGGASDSTTIITLGPSVGLGETRFNGKSVRMNSSVEAFYMTAATFFLNAQNPSSFTAAATLAVSDLTGNVVVFTGAANANLTLPTGAALDAAFPNLLRNVGFEFSVIATGAGAATLANATGVTRVGSGTVDSGTSGRFLLRRTWTAETWVIYRL